MPMYKMKLEVEVSCPTREGQPELTITPTEIRAALLKLDKPHAGYAICASMKRVKLTANMRVTKAEFEPLLCEHCGHKIEVPE